MIIKLVENGISKTIETHSNRILFGRSSMCDVRFDSDVVSGTHAAIEIAASECTVTDLDSANGIFVNGRATHSAQLFDGCSILLGLKGPEISIVSGAGKRAGKKSLLMLSALGCFVLTGLVLALLVAGISFAFYYQSPSSQVSDGNRNSRSNDSRVQSKSDNFSSSSPVKSISAIVDSTSTSSGTPTANLGTSSRKNRNGSSGNPGAPTTSGTIGSNIPTPPSSNTNQPDASSGSSSNSSTPPPNAAVKFKVGDKVMSPGMHTWSGKIVGVSDGPVYSVRITYAAEKSIFNRVKYVAGSTVDLLESEIKLKTSTSLGEAIDLFK